MNHIAAFKKELAEFKSMIAGFESLMELDAEEIEMKNVTVHSEFSSGIGDAKDKKVVAYVRTTIDDSAQVLSQIEQIVQSLLAGEQPKFCAFQLYIDCGFSGLDVSRPAYQALLQDMNDGKVAELIVVGMDRLSRSPEAFEEIIHIARENNVEITTIL